MAVRSIDWLGVAVIMVLLLASEVTRRQVESEKERLWMRRTVVTLSVGMLILVALAMAEESIPSEMRQRMERGEAAIHEL